jgi:hypothetical protein
LKIIGSFVSPVEKKSSELNKSLLFSLNGCLQRINVIVLSTKQMAD